MGSVTEPRSDATPIDRSLDSWRVHGAETHMVGRQAELDKMLDLFKAVVGEGRLRAAILVGPPGIGKSRLIDEFSRIINTRFGNALLVSGDWRDDSEGAYAIMGRVLRNRFYIPERLPEEDARQRLLEGIRGLVKNPIALEIAHRIGRLIDLPYPNSPFGQSDTPEAMREACWRALAKLVRTDAQANPLVVVLEDMHLAGAESLSLIPFLARALADVPIMCVISATNEVDVKHPQVLAQLPDIERIDLAPLADDEVRQVVHKILPGQRSARRIGRSGDYQAAWIPGAEEILRILIAEGAIDTNESDWRIYQAHCRQLPGNLSDVLQAGMVRRRRRNATSSAGRGGGRTFWPDP
jgi:hypothetical protein